MYFHAHSRADVSRAEKVIAGGFKMESFQRM
jgi:hypothetical protein